MKIRPFFEKCVNNWPAKVICLVLAVLLYFFYHLTTLDTKIIAVPLSVSAQGNMLPAEFTDSSVRVTLRGKSDEIARIKSGDISAYLDIDTYTVSGRYDVPVQIKLDPTLMVIEPLEVKVSPVVVSMDISERAFVQVPVSANIQGSVAAGYQITAVSVTPSTVLMTGAERIIKAVSSVYSDSISADGKTASFSQSVPVLNRNALISFAGDRNVDVSVTVEPVKLTRSFENQPVYLYGLPAELEAACEPAAVSFTLNGNQLSLESYKPELYTARADCSKLSAAGTYEVPLELAVPAGVSVVSKTAETVSVTVTAAANNDDSEPNIYE